MTDIDAEQHLNDARDARDALLQRCQRCETREDARWEGCDGVGVQKPMRMLEPDDSLLDGRSFKFVRPANAFDSRDAMELELSV